MGNCVSDEVFSNSVEHNEELIKQRQKNHPHLEKAYAKFQKHRPHLRHLLGIKTSTTSLDPTSDSDKHNLLIECEKSTKFGYSELRVLLRIFLNASDNKSVISKPRLGEILPALFAKQDDHYLVGDSIFAALDLDKDGNIQFEEFAKAMSVLAYGSLEEKSKLSFQILDLDGNGILEIDEVRKVVAVFRLVLTELGYEDANFGEADEIVDRLFTMMEEEDGGQVKGKALFHQFMHQGKDKIELAHHVQKDYISRLKSSMHLSGNELEKSTVKKDEVEEVLLEGDEDTDSDSDQEENADISEIETNVADFEENQRKKREKQTDESEESPPATTPLTEEAIEEHTNSTASSGIGESSTDSSLGGSKKRVILGGGIVFNKGTASQPRMSTRIELRKYLGSKESYSESQEEVITHCREEEQEQRKHILDELVKVYRNLDLQSFLARAKNSPDVVHCFGLFQYFNDTIINPMQENTAILKLNEDSQYFGMVLVRKNYHWNKVNVFGVAHIGFVALYSLESFTQKQLKDRDLDELRKDVMKLLPLRVLCAQSIQVDFAETASCEITITLDETSLHLKTESPSEVLSWLQVLRNTHIPRHVGSNRYNSFAPLRENCQATWFVNGKEYFKDLFRHLKHAQHEIMIAGWWVHPYVCLKRYGEKKKKKVIRLLDVLNERAKAGVNVYVLMWKETEMGMLLGSQIAKYDLRRLNSRVKVIRHPKNFPLYWSHHQKHVIIDRCKAYVGGIDLCLMRYDDTKFRLTDEKKSHFPGRDYGNLCVYVERVGNPDEDQVDRNSVPRMPWHDIHMTLEGDAVKDVMYNFVQRWNFAVEQYRKKSYWLFPRGYEKETSVTCLTERKRAVEEKQKRLIQSGLKQKEDRLLFPCKAQVVRSASPWSAGIQSIENSIYRAYVDLIANSKHFVFIENQYFISSISASKPQNKIAKSLFKRICRAIEEKENFKVIIIIPVYPAGNPNDMATRYVIHWVYNSISRGEDGVLESLARKYPKVDLDKYITFFSLRNWAVLQEKPVTEQVYIHSKLMIVDDRYTIIGSANINDRSMDGARDSELCVVVEDTEFIASRMDGEEYQAGKFALSLRMRIFRLILGLDVNEGEKVLDPVNDETMELIIETARKNWSAYTKVFSGIPENSPTLEDFKTHLEQSTLPLEEAVDILKSEVRGYLIPFPEDFLIEENNAPTPLSPEFYVPLSVFL